jgi:chemotaxis protein MotB
MAQEKQKPKQEEDSVEGAPLWIISFADMISLLMAFFVMLSTLSSFGPAEAEKLQRTVKAVLDPIGFGGWYPFRPRTAIGPQAVAAGQIEKGSDRPTLDETQGPGLLAETKAGDFRTRKVFTIESSRVFWGAGTTLSQEGRAFLNTLAAYATKLPDRIVVCETGPDNNPESGLLRAVTVLTHLGVRGVSKDRCSIGARSMLPPEDRGGQRMLEVVLLDESVYK